MHRGRMLAVIGLVLATVLSGCAARNYSDSEIKSFSTFNIETLKRSEYSVLASVKGVGRITVTAMSIQGDTGKYGYINEMSVPFTVHSLSKTAVPKEPEMIAKRNAIFDAIVQAQKAGADALWMPQYTTEVSEDKSGTIIICTVYAKAIKIKEDIDISPKDQTSQPVAASTAKPEPKKAN